MAITLPNLLCICIVINGSDRGGGFTGDNTDLVGDLVGEDFDGELCLDDELERRRDVFFSLAVNTWELGVVELEGFDGVTVEFDFVPAVTSLLVDGGALTDPHELPRNSEPVLGSQSRGTCALGLEFSANLTPKMSVDVDATLRAQALLDMLSADSMTRTNSRSSLADMVTGYKLYGAGSEIIYWNAADTSCNV